MQMVFDAVRKAQKKDPKPDIRHGIVHCQITDENLLKQFQELNMLAYIQPVFLKNDAAVAPARVGENMAKTSYAFKTLIDLGVHVSLGTDCPVEPFDPLANIYYAVTRKFIKNGKDCVFYPDQRLTAEEAVYRYTAEGAYASREEGIKGTLTAGKFADMAVLSDNIFEIEPEKINDVNVVMTVLNGEIVYER
jgi:predicted amidohydrolase YtcJ